MLKDELEKQNQLKKNYYLSNLNHVGIDQI
jgi:hypothetical protein